MDKEKIKKLLGLIIWSDTIPAELKKDSLELVLNNLGNEKLLEELLNKIEKKIEAEEVSFIRQINK